MKTYGVNVMVFVPAETDEAAEASVIETLRARDGIDFQVWEVVEVEEEV